MMTMSRRNLLATLAGLFGTKLTLQPGSAAAEEGAFPADFVWGASTSSYQIEGAVDVDGRGKSIWDTFSHSPGRTKNGDTGDVACDHYHRWAQDIEWLARGGFNAYRFSTAWPRILPSGVGAVEHRGLDFYDRLVDGLMARGIAPWLCLYHWDLPQALQDEGGWVKRDTADKFADYASVVARRLGDRVKHWAMFNEPNVHALFGYGAGSHASMLAASHHQNLAHGRALQALRTEHSGLRLGTVVSLQPVRASSDNPDDQRAAERFDALWNGAFADPLLKGFYPAAVAAEFAPVVVPGDLEIIHQPMDFLGINYYSRMYVANAPGSLLGAWWGPIPAGTRFTAMGWPVTPEGLYEELTSLRERYGDLELYVAENGACYDDRVDADGTVHDEDRIAFISDHLTAARRALAEGVNLRGYFVWSLLDNFEWAEGYTRRFGIIRVDFSSLKRTPKASFAFLADTIRRRG
jgi:beta-glucosidase